MYRCMMKVCNDTATAEIYTLFFLMIRPPPRSTLFPDTTLFRSRSAPGLEHRPAVDDERRARDEGRAGEVHHGRSEEHTSELQSRQYLVCRLLLEKKHTNISYAVFCCQKK